MNHFDAGFFWGMGALIVVALLMAWISWAGSERK